MLLGPDQIICYIISLDIEFPLYLGFCTAFSITGALSYPSILCMDTALSGCPDSEVLSRRTDGASLIWKEIQMNISFTKTKWKILQYSSSPNLKEKLPQAFMQIGWIEDDFRNLTAKLWANLDNPIKRYDFSKVSLILCMSPSQVALF